MDPVDTELAEELNAKLLKCLEKPNFSNEDIFRKAEQILNGLLRLLRTRLHKRCHISRVPSEILYRIFDMYEEDVVPQHDDQGLRWRWLVFTHVCRHWRDVAAWSTIDMAWSVDRIKDALRRVPPDLRRGLRLHIRELESFPEPAMLKPKVDALTDEMPWKSLHFYIHNSNQISQTIIDAVAQSAPCLEDLCLVDMSEESKVWPPITLNSEARLKELTCERVWPTIILNPSFWGGICNLTIRSVPDGADILDAFGKMTGLERIEIIDSMPIQANQNPSSFPTFPRLRYLRLSGKMFADIKYYLTALKSVDLHRPGLEVNITIGISSQVALPSSLNSIIPEINTMHYQSHTNGIQYPTLMLIDCGTNPGGFDAEQKEGCRVHLMNIPREWEEKSGVQDILRNINF
ncbi:hypothetical protein FA95DRAFT_1575246 [Auriscalpium vulgare]|uniref:Uncharacterized protein n=1 Tax=Auriscalpium vulgare TaxID=40419 RepID=A0ACB8RG87_9AGAM|nr:hypothetical protein FA95DRAFT_1575246 [Auriscalpium vulgare]